MDGNSEVLHSVSPILIFTRIEPQPRAVPPNWRRIAAACGYACNDRLVAWRTGWWSKRWNFAEIGKIQALRLAQSPLDRRLGMASLLLDTAGASPFGAPLHLRQLPVDLARALSARIVAHLSRRPT